MPNNEKIIRRIAIAGIGNVGSHILRAIHEAGYQISYIFSRDKSKAKSFALNYGGTGLAYGDKMDKPVDVIILCVPDDMIIEVGKHFTGVNSLIAHTSGSTSIEVLDDISALYGVIYPLQTFSQDVPLTYSNIPFCIEGSSEMVSDMLTGIASSLSPKVFKVDSEQRKLLHVSAVFACNFSNHMASISQRLMEKSNLDFSLLLPLIEETYEKIRSSNPIKMQTGPAIRADQDVVQKHIDILANTPFEQELYRMISENILRYKK